MHEIVIMTQQGLIAISTPPFATLGPQTITPVTYATSYPTAVPTVYYYNYPIRVRTIDDSSEGFETLRRRFGKVEITVKWTPVPDAKFYIVMQRVAPPVNFSALLTTNSSFFSETEASPVSQSSPVKVAAPLRRQSHQWYNTHARVCGHVRVRMGVAWMRACCARVCVCTHMFLCHIVRDCALVHGCLPVRARACFLCT